MSVWPFPLKSSYEFLKALKFDSKPMDALQTITDQDIEFAQLYDQIFSHNVSNYSDAYLPEAIEYQSWRDKIREACEEWSKSKNVCLLLLRGFSQFLDYIF